MLSKDQGETIKKYTKIMIKNQNGEFAVIDWNLENNDSNYLLIQKKKSIEIQASVGLWKTLRKIKEFKKKREKNRKDNKINISSTISKPKAILPSLRLITKCFGLTGTKYLCVSYPSLWTSIFLNLLLHDFNNLSMVLIINE